MMTEDEMSDETSQGPRQDSFPYAETTPGTGYGTSYGSDGQMPTDYEYEYDSDGGNGMVGDMNDGAVPSAPDAGNGRRGLSNRAKGVITLALVGAYLLWPADIVPDIAIGLGQVDDAIVFAMGVATILMRLRGPKE